MKILDFIYPQVCGMCGKLDKRSLCRKCEIRLEKQAICKIEDYRNTTSFFDEHFYMFMYDGEIRELLLNYKFNNKAYLYKTFLNFILKNEKMCVQMKKYDIIIPVPISRKRMKQRGYNQCSVFAKELAKNINVFYTENVLIKINNNQPQSELNKEDRVNNVKNVYAIKNDKIIQNKKILLIDDIYTTGSTVNECSKVLMEKGAKSIGVFTITKD